MGRKHCGKKEKLLVTSNFSFSHSVFKRLVLQTRKNQGLFGKELKDLGEISNVNIDTLIKHLKVFCVRDAGSKDFQKRHSSCFDFHSSIIRLIQTERVSKQRLLSFDFGRFLELMSVFLSGIRYNFICLTYLSTSRNTIGRPVMSGKFDGGPINKHQNTGPTERQNLAVRLALNNMPLKVNKNSFPMFKLKVLCGKFQSL